MHVWRFLDICLLPLVTCPPFVLLLCLVQPVRLFQFLALLCELRTLVFTGFLGSTVCTVLKHYLRSSASLCSSSQTAAFLCLCLYSCTWECPVDKSARELMAWRKQSKLWCLKTEASINDFSKTRECVIKNCRTIFAEEQEIELLRTEGWVANLIPLSSAFR